MNLLSYQPLTDDKIEFQEMRGHFKPANVFVTTIPAAAELRAYDAKLISTEKPKTETGALLINDEFPITFIIDVKAQKSGIYEIVPEISLNTDGWKRHILRPIQPVKILCVSRDRQLSDTPRPIEPKPPNIK